MIRIIFSHKLERQIRTHAQRDYPQEGCGALAGRIEGDIRYVTEVHALTNLRAKENAAHRYLLDPAEQLRLERDLETRGLTLLGFYHSHPDAAARPSPDDLDHAWPFYLYVIVSVRHGKSAELTAWLLREDCSVFDEIRIKS